MSLRIGTTRLSPRCDSILAFAASNTTPILRGAEPEISRPNLDVELAMEKDRRERPTTAQIEHSHAGTKLESLAQPFSEPQRIGSTSRSGKHPVGVVFRRARKRVRGQSLIGTQTDSPVGQEQRDGHRVTGLVSRDSLVGRRNATLALRTTPHGE